MINVSQEFKETMKYRTDFRENAEVNFTDGTVLKLTPADFTVTNNGVVDGAGSSGFPVGAAIGRRIQIELMNDTDKFSQYDFFGAKIRLWMTFQLSKTIEKIECGIFTVITPNTLGETITVTAVDDMYKADKPYTTNLNFPQSAQIVLRDICTQLGIILETDTFKNYDFMIQQKPSSDFTFRKIIGDISMLAGGNARLNRLGRLEILSYDYDFLKGKSKEYHDLKDFISLENDTSDIIITGVQISYDTLVQEELKEQVDLFGTDDYVLKLESPLFYNKGKEVGQLLSDLLIGVHLRKFSGDYIAYPLAEFMDNCIIWDRKGNQYRTVLTDIDFNFFGITTFKNSAESALTNNNDYEGAGSQTLQKAKKLVEQERTQREAALKDLANQLGVSSGLYMTTEIQPDGSTIYYMHDQPTLAESKIVWKLTAQAFGISTDGGKTYSYGLDATGQAILNRIYAIGINADYITTGRISDAQNKNYWNLNTGEFQITINTTVSEDQTLQEYVDNTANNAVEGVKDSVASIKGTVDSIQVEIQSTAQDLQNTNSKVNKMTYELGTEFLEIKKSNTEMSTRISENGMIVYKNDIPVLTANNAGVDAVNLHANTYLIIGNNSRFEDYKGTRTGCFWIG